ncbi:hypothetical protein H4R35_005473 [Dimargaris xerosporica]|nr:hypothetical protein H4R35_005473 [Dimargaris xerosporica]
MAFHRFLPTFARDMEQVMAQVERSWYPTTRGLGNGMCDWYWEPVVLRHPRAGAHKISRRRAIPNQTQVAAPAATESTKPSNAQASERSTSAANTSSAQPREDCSQQPSTVHLASGPTQPPVFNWLAPFVAPWAVTPGGPFADPWAMLDADTTTTTAPRLAHATWTETDHAYQLDVDLPGIPKENVTLSWDEGNTLVIKGETHSTVQADAGNSVEVVENQSQADSATSTFTTTIESEDASEDRANAEEHRASSGTVEVKSSTAPATQQVYRSFERSFTFPDHVDPERITARLDNGLLKIEVPKRERVAKTIPITF